jgi:hypothetical protein
MNDREHAMNVESAQAFVVEFARTQLDGDLVPRWDSAAVDDLSAAIQVIQAASERDLAVLGLLMLGAIIDRVSAALETERVLANISSGEASC